MAEPAPKPDQHVPLTLAQQRSLLGSALGYGLLVVVLAGMAATVIASYGAGKPAADPVFLAALLIGAVAGVLELVYALADLIVGEAVVTEQQVVKLSRSGCSQPPSYYVFFDRLGRRTVKWRQYEPLLAGGRYVVTHSRISKTIWSIEPLAPPAEAAP